MLRNIGMLIRDICLIVILMYSISIAIAVILKFNYAFGQEMVKDLYGYDGNKHPPEHQQLHNEFYDKLTQPGTANASCCNNKDCRPIPHDMVRIEDGVYWVFIGYKWWPIPPEKIIKKPYYFSRKFVTPPDGRYHLCSIDFTNSKWTNRNNIHVMCFWVPYGGS